MCSATFSTHASHQVYYNTKISDWATQLSTVSITIVFGLSKWLLTIYTLCIWGETYHASKWMIEAVHPFSIYYKATALFKAYKNTKISSKRHIYEEKKISTKPVVASQRWIGWSRAVVANTQLTGSEKPTNFHIRYQPHTRASINL